MFRILIAAIVLLTAAYFYLNQGGDGATPLEVERQALEKAEAVEQTLKEHADALQEKIDDGGA